MKKLIARLLSFSLVIGLAVQISLFQTNAHAETINITDFNQCASFSRDSVQRLVSQGIIMGGTDGSFNPRGYVTRAQVVTFIVRSLGLSLINPDSPTFRDLYKSHWSYQYIETAYAYGITAGTSPYDFTPDRYCTREEMVTMLVRAIGIDNKKVSTEQLEGIINNLKDKDQISPWARTPLAYAFSQGIISGYNNYLTPKNLATREQTAVILDKYLNGYALSYGTTPVTVPDLSTSNIPKITKSVVMIISYDKQGNPLAQGSGFAVGNSLFLTNFHVLESGYGFKILTEDGSLYDAAGIVKYDRNTDLALIKAKQPLNIDPLVLGSADSVVQGQQVLAVGNPLGLQNTVSNGIISAIRQDTDLTLLQTTAPITFGSSGGPLFDLQGRVIGITSSGFDSGNLNFAVPIDYASDWVDSLKGQPFTNVYVIDQASEFNNYLTFTSNTISGMLDGMFRALGSEDLTAYKSYLDTENPMNALAYSIYSPIFDMYDLTYQLKSSTLTSLSSGTAEVDVSYVITKRAGPDYRDREMLGKYVVRYDGQNWKVVSMEDNVVKYLDGAGDSGNVGPIDASVAASSTLPSNKFLMNLKVTDAVEDPEKPVIYITDKAAKKLFAVNYETHQISQISFSLVPEKLDIANGKLYISLLKREHSPYWWTDQQTGAIAVVDASSMQLVKQFDIAMDPYGIKADNNGKLYVSPGSGQWSFMRVYSAESGTEISKSPTKIYNMTSIDLNYQTNTFYYSSGTPWSLGWLHTDDNGQFLGFGDSSIYGRDHDLNYNLRVSPDGKFLFNGLGPLYFSSMHYITTLKPFNDIAFDIDNDAFYISNDAAVYEYSYAQLKPILRYDPQGKAVRIFKGKDKLAIIIDSNGSYSMETLTLGQSN